MRKAIGFVRRAMFGIALSVALTSCASLPGPTPGASEPANLGQLKTRLRAYHEQGYQRDFDAVIARAQTFILARASQVQRPAIVLDIDETSLSSWTAMAANDFGYFPGGTCDALPRGPCGNDAWENSAQAPAFPTTLALYNAARQAGVAVFFVTGRREGRRDATTRNLQSAGYRDWAGLSLRPVDSHGTAAEYKSGARAAIEAQGYTIVANIGDQQSDLDGGHAERAFKLPNPFYFIP